MQLEFVRFLVGGHSFLTSNIWGYKQNFPYDLLRDFKISPYEEMEKNISLKEIEEISLYEPFYSGYMSMNFFNNMFNVIMKGDVKKIFETAGGFDQLLIPSVVANFNKKKKKQKNI